MIPLSFRIMPFVAGLGCATSSAYFLLCLWSAARFLQRRSTSAGIPSSDAMPPVSILKPLKGIDPEMYESFRSHCVQDYPQYEIIFAVSDPSDPACAGVQRLQREFPERAIQLVVSSHRLGANTKVSNLEQMQSAARFSHLIVNDSDIRVSPDYLRRVMAPLRDERVGMVTCLYRGIAAPSFGSRLESLGISTDFSAGVLVARQLEGGLRFGLGSTLAFRRNSLDQIGGFKAIVDFLADDYELGRRISDLGLKVVLSEVVVETHLPAYDFGGFLAHQLRWARGVRDSRLGGYIGVAFTFGLLWSGLNLAVAHAASWSWAVLGIVTVLRVAVALVVGHRVLQDRQIFRQLWLLPVRDFIAVGVWIVSLCGHRVTWRGEQFQLKRGRLTRVDR
jgi:ceramide glucosyltransferase